MTTLATAIGENSGTLEEAYEPFLIQEGLLVRTPRGRQATSMLMSIWEGKRLGLQEIYLSKNVALLSNKKSVGQTG